MGEVLRIGIKVKEPFLRVKRLRRSSFDVRRVDGIVLRRRLKEFPLDNPMSPERTIIWGGGVGRSVRSVRGGKRKGRKRS
jgi:hypothetical protein